MSQSNTTGVRPLYVRVAATPWRWLNQMILQVANRFGEERSKEVERFLKFIVVGVMGALIDFGTLFLLQATILHPDQPYQQVKVLTASTISFFAAIASNFLWNRFWTYPDSRSRSLRRQLAQFTFLNAIGLIVRTLWIKWTYLPIGRAITPSIVAIVHLYRPEYVPSAEASVKIGSVAAQFMAILIVMMWNFFANRYWTYNDVN
ncbi:MAG: GtrA family protein [Phototrophicaceae bacterium]|jgi:putative flippase GtrA